MHNALKFGHVLKNHGLVPALIKALARATGRRVMVKGIDEDYPVRQPLSDKAMPTMYDARACHLGYARWNHVLPLPNDRMMLHIGAETVENFFVVADAWAQVLSRFIRPNSHVMDVGCGCGRTARLLALNANVERFTGYDVVKPYIAWCQRFFEEIYPGRFQFHHLDIRSARYNPNGKLSCNTLDFPSPDAAVDFLFAASVFTHLLPEDAAAYSQQMVRVLKPDGLVVVSIHDRPAAGSDFSGDENRADYAPDYFIEIMQDAGLRLVEDIGDLCGQHTFLLRKIDS